MNLNKLAEYIRFMSNKDNEFKCAKCPANEGLGDDVFNICYPCGQQNCWVTVHCEREDYDRVEYEERSKT